MAEETTGSVGEATEEKPKVPNEINPGTGQFDARFMLWRTFCAENGVAVETLPSDLKGEIKDKWEKLKDERLHKPAEKSDGDG